MDKEHNQKLDYRLHESKVEYFFEASAFPQ